MQILHELCTHSSRQRLKKKASASEIPSLRGGALISCANAARVVHESAAVECSKQQQPERRERAVCRRSAK